MLVSDLVKFLQDHLRVRVSRNVSRNGTAAIHVKLTLEGIRDAPGQQPYTVNLDDDYCVIGPYDD